MSDAIALVRSERRGHAAWITLASPANHNALSQQLCEELTAALDAAEADAGARVIVLAAEGRSFCAGADLKSAGGGAVSGAHRRAAFVDVLQRMWECPKPVIGRVQGGAYGGGLGLIAACDLAVCSDAARFAFTEVRLGVVPAFISVFVLRKVSLAQVTPLFLNGERFDAAQAQALGLVHRVVPAEGVDAALDAELASLRMSGPTALREAKALLRTVPHLSIAEGLDWAQAKNNALFPSEEAQEGRAAFAAKRPPAWAMDE